MIYFTFSDPPSGVYSSQVLEVCRFLEKECGQKVRLLALISIRGFFQNREKIKAQYPHATILPMFPRLRNWKWNLIWLRLFCLFTGEKILIARGPFATGIALALKRKGGLKKVVFDARGAYHAELTEYQVVEDQKIIAEIRAIEKEAIFQSDFRLAVSAQLVEYWKREYQYQALEHAIVPCALSPDFLKSFPDESRLAELRKKNGFSESDIVLVFSGSSAGWQSFSWVDAILSGMLAKNACLRVLFLAKSFPENLQCAQTFPARVQSRWLPESEVRDCLLACDYGILLREDTVTNRVASPVKFAEYLACGLPVLISENLGDNTDLLIRENLGKVVLPDRELPILTSPEYTERHRVSAFASSYFRRRTWLESYKKMLDVLEQPEA